MSGQRYWPNELAPDRPYWQEMLLFIFAPWVRQRWFSPPERWFLCLFVWAIIIFQIVLPIIFLT